MIDVWHSCFSTVSRGDNGDLLASLQSLYTKRAGTNLRSPVYWDATYDIVLEIAKAAAYKYTHPTEYFSRKGQRGCHREPAEEKRDEFEIVGGRDVHSRNIDVWCDMHNNPDRSDE